MITPRAAPAGTAPVELAQPPSLGELLAISLRIGLISFGGAAGQIAMMHRIYVDEKRWVSDADFVEGLNFCTLLPGPEAQQLATYIGWRLHGVAGGLISGVLFVAPSAALILLLAQLYVLGAGLPLVSGLLLGIKAAVVAIVAQAVLKIATRALAGPAFRLLAMAAFAAMSFTLAPFPLVIALAALVGVALASGDPVASPRLETGRVAARPALVAARPALVAALASLVAWWLPVALAALLLGGGHLLVEIGLFFSRLAVITFGGAYTVLAYLSEEGVRRGWASAAEMVDALGLAETTPGPTILVNPFIAFLAGERAGGAVLGWLAGLMALWTTFAPSFLWIFAGGPMIGRVTRDPRLAGALRGISAAVVGIIATVALRFAIVVVFAAPERLESWPFQVLLPMGPVRWSALALALLALLLLFAFRWPMLRMLALVAALGGAISFLG